MSTRTAGPIPAGSIRTPLTACALIVLFAITAAAQVGPPPVPAENPITPEKTVLGKILFWDEQLSSDNTTSCGTCHQPRFGAGDARSVQTAGPDGIPGNDDDTFGSPGVIRSDASNRYIADLLFDFAPRVTPRLAPTVFMSAFSPELFWDGRAETAFRDPQTGQIVIGSGASLESLAVAPQVNDIEMAHEERDWDQIVAKLEAVIPMHLASNLPADVQTALGAGVTYPDLYSAAFGDPMIDAPRTAMAIATYLRTLVPEQTPFDAFVQGDGTALTPAQQAGLNLFNGQAFCFACHRPNDFSDHLFHNTGIRPASEDVGRMAVTNDPLDIGKFKTPSLRNVGLRPRLTHGGHFGSLEEIVEFYDRGGDFHEHQDPLIRPLGLTPLQKTQLVDFLRNGLTDPRVAAAQFPFDRPTLYSERLPANPRVFGTGHPGSGGFVPSMIANSPPAIANPDFKIGVHAGLGGATAVLGVARSMAPPGTTHRGAPVYIGIQPMPKTLQLTLSGSGAGAGHATIRKGLPNRASLVGRMFFAQWFIFDAGASQGLSASDAAELTIF